MRKKMSSKVLCLMLFLAFVWSPGSAQEVEITGDQDTNLIRDAKEGFSLNLAFEDWAAFLGYEEHEELFGPREERFTLRLSRDLDDQRFSFSLRDAHGEAGHDLGGYLFWEHGSKDTERFGFESAYAKKDFGEFLIPADDQEYLRLFLRTARGVEFSLFGSRYGTADVVNGAESFATLPRSTLFGERTFADVRLAEDVVESFYGASVGFASEGKSGFLSVKQGKQFIRGFSEPDDFTAYGGFFRSERKHFSENVEFDLRDVKTVDSTFYESRLFLDTRATWEPAEFGFGAYSRGISTEFDPDLFLHFYDSAGGGLTAAFRVAEGYKLGFWGMAEENAPHFHTVVRGALFLRTPYGEFGFGRRMDLQGMTRFETETNGYFVTAKSRYVDGILGVQEGEYYGTLSLTVRGREGKTKEGEFPFLGKDEAWNHSALLPVSPGVYSENPLLSSRLNLEWSEGGHAASLYTKRSVMGLGGGQGTSYRFLENGGTYRFSSNSFRADLAFALRNFPEFGISEPTGRAGVMRQFGNVDIGVGWLRERLFVDESREAKFVFFEIPVGIFKFEQAIGEQNHGMFISANFSLGTGSPSRELLPTHLLPAVARNQAKTRDGAVAEIPGPKRLWINVHNAGYNADEIAYLSEHRAAYQGARIGPRLVCTAVDAPGDEHCYRMHPEGDPQLEKVLDIFGPDGVLVIVDDDLNSRPWPNGEIPPDGMYQKVKNLLLYDERIVNVQCLGEPLNSGNTSPERYVRVYLPACRKAIDEVNQKRPAGLKAMLWDAGSFGNSSGIREKQRSIRAGSLQYTDVVTCHIYPSTEEEALRMARECKALARGKPVAMTESNYAKNAAGSSYVKHAWWLGTIMPKIEKILAAGLSPDKLKYQANVFYTLRADEGRQFNLLDPRTLRPTSDAHKIIEARVAFTTGAAQAPPKTAADGSRESPGAGDNTLYPANESRRIAPREIPKEKKPVE